MPKMDDADNSICDVSLRGLIPKPYRLSPYEHSELAKKEVLSRLNRLSGVGIVSYSIQVTSRYIRDRFWGRYADDPIWRYLAGSLKWLHGGFSGFLQQRKPDFSL